MGDLRHRVQVIVRQVSEVEAPERLDGSRRAVHQLDLESPFQGRGDVLCSEGFSYVVSGDRPRSCLRLVPDNVVAERLVLLTG